MRPWIQGDPVWRWYKVVRPDGWIEYYYTRGELLFVAAINPLDARDRIARILHKFRKITKLRADSFYANKAHL